MTNPRGFFLALLVTALLLGAGCTEHVGTEKKRVDADNNSIHCGATLNYSPFTPKVISPVQSGNQDFPLPLDKYVFVEHIVRINGRTITGDCSPAIYFDGPMYSFDEPDGTLHTILPVDEPVNVSLILFFASGMSESDSTRTGAVLSAYPVYRLPHQTRDNVTLDSITPEGVVSIQYLNSTAVLKPKDTWVISTTRKTENRYSYRHTLYCTEEIVTTDSFYNAGLFNKQNITPKYFGNNGKFIDFNSNSKQVYKQSG
jgi:hypothetical protein